MLERLQKIISKAGIASRRHAEKLILSGAVTVNGHVVMELGTKADPEHDHITVGPRTVRFVRAPERYLAFYKPAQVVSTMNDPEGRPCLRPYLRGFKGRLFPVGRLDFDASGLLLLTSDGELASDLMRAAAVVPQTWRIKVKGRIAGESQQQIERAARVRLRVHRDAPNAWYEADLAAGPGSRDRLGQALQRHSILVEKMLRWKFAGADLAGLEPGEMRELTPEELRGLRRAAAGRRENFEHRIRLRRTKNENLKSAQRTADDGIPPAHRPRRNKGRGGRTRPAPRPGVPAPRGTERIAAGEGVRDE
jgi:23S rRNA pseudouridine2605 synthase